MDLPDYPEAIARAQTAAMDARMDREDAEELVIDLRSQIEGEIAFDKELKNEAQRKVALAERLREDRDLNKAIAELRDARIAQSQAEIDLERIQNHFAVLKILKRHETAVLEAQKN